MEYLAYVGPIWVAPVIPIPMSLINNKWNNLHLPRTKKRDVYDSDFVVPTTEDTQTWTEATTTLLAKFKRKAKKGKTKGKAKGKAQAKKVALQEGIELDHMPLIGQAGERGVDGAREVRQGEKRVASTSVMEWARGKIPRKRRTYLSRIFRRSGDAEHDEGEAGESDRPNRGRY